MELHIPQYTKRFSLVTFLFGLTFLCNAQIKSSYSLGGLFFDQTKSIAFSGPLLVESKQCVNLFNGIEQFSVLKKGVFVSSCIVKPFNGSAFSINSYPNPFTDYFFVNLNSLAPIIINDKVILELINVDGVIVYSKSITRQELRNGIKIFTSKLPTGSYILGAKSNQLKSEFIKLIKL